MIDFIKNFIDEVVGPFLRASQQEEKKD